MASPYAQLAAFALGRLGDARSALSSASEQAAGEARATLDLADSSELRAAAANDPVLKERVAAAAKAAKQALEDLQSASTTWQPLFQQLEQDLKKLMER